jgi:hypothetical protein
MGLSFWKIKFSQTGLASFRLNRYTLLRYEDLLDNPVEALRRIFLDLNLKFDKRYLVGMVIKKFLPHL